MARTHRGTIDPPVAGSRLRVQRSGGMVGNYVTMLLTGRVSLAGAGAAMDRTPLPADFRVSQISYYRRSTTGTWNYLMEASGSSNSAMHTSAAGGADDTKVVILTSGLDQTHDTAGRPKRNVPAGYSLRFSTSGTPTGDGGDSCAWVTGYFTSPINRDARYRESGVSRVGGPVAGYYDVWTLPSVGALAGVQAGVVTCRFAAPYAARIETVSWDFRGHTVAGANIGAKIMNGAVDIMSGYALAVASTDTQGITDTSTNPTFVSSAVRDVAKGDEIRLVINMGNAGDALPAFGVTGSVLVWCKGHVNDTGYPPTVED